MTNFAYAIPDFAQLRESRAAIRYQSIVGSANLYIKALSDELISLNAAISSTDQLVANAITSAITALETDDLRENLEALAVLNAREPDHNTKKAIALYSKIANQLMEMCTDQLSQLHIKLHTGLFNVQSVSISDNRFRLAELADSRIGLAKELSVEQAALNEVVSDERILNEAIKLFEKMTFIDRIKPLFEQLAGLAGKPQTPETAAMEAGLAVAFKFLDEANELVKYRDLLRARQIVQTRIGQRQERVSSLEQQLRTNENHTRQLNDTQKVIPHQHTYVSETTKLVDTLSMFLKSIMPGTDDDMLKTGERLIERSQSLLAYMNILQGRWLRG
ncbi:alpha-xenorhabdolysin family binary toxin subunit B [Pseudomonas sp. B21-015]|uniref:alpha-xenorhabdolysin family binary toxin subunit B n=1 Tax=Pseudomonas sp. B21-015 TaxID=2895473 RepID=UPI0021604B14|nr:alpha-xenorhabdolysin family binary toxin subunit B [Pseudomonas sp. B21-015]UVM49662.1 alpha-xenorhabdolysin family binary toxin subunit B [Pseudomonas sp. B21-015]